MDCSVRKVCEDIDNQMEKNMLQEAFLSAYSNFKLHFYTNFVERTKEDSLTTVEAFCMEIICSINHPTINEFAKAANISSPNAAYKVNNLIKKGYLRKVQSEDDRREYHLEVTDKYINHDSSSSGYIGTVMKRMEEQFSEEELTIIEEALYVMSDELAPKITLGAQ